MERDTVNIHAEIIDRCRRGDASAEYELYRLYSRSMFNTALRICGNREEAEDALQESFVSAFRSIKSYRGDSTFGAWLKRIVINKSISALKKNARDMMMIEEEGGLEMSDEEPTESQWTVDQIKSAVQDLPAGFRMVLSLYLFEGYDHREISQILGITESTSKSQYKRAKDKLKTVLLNELKYG